MTKKHAGGAPRRFDRKAVLLKIRDEMAKGDKGLIDICESSNEFPTHASIYLWITEQTPQGRELFDIFREAQALWCWAQKDKLVKISDDESRDVIENIIESTNENGETIIKVERRSDNTAVNRDKLRIGVRQWAMTKLLPNVFGEKITTEMTGKNGGPIEFTETVDRSRTETPEEWQKRVSQELLARKNQLVQ